MAVSACHWVLEAAEDAMTPKKGARNALWPLEWNEGTSAMCGVPKKNGHNPLASSHRDIKHNKKSLVLVGSSLATSSFSRTAVVRSPPAELWSLWISERLPYREYLPMGMLSLRSELPISQKPWDSAVSLLAIPGGWQRGGHEASADGYLAKQRDSQVEPGLAETNSCPFAATGVPGVPLSPVERLE